jgi:hypothetical protein
VTSVYRRLNWGTGQDVAEQIAVSYQPYRSSHVLVEPDRQGWMIEVPAVLWMLDQLTDGALSVAAARSTLLGMTAWRSGCCYWCDELPPDWLHRQLAARQEWERSQRAKTAHTHPYIVNGATIKVLHRWDCATVTVEPPMVITDRHQYATIAPALGKPRHRGPWRVSTPEVQAWVEHGRVPARCQVCEPVLPDLDDTQWPGVTQSA